MVALVSFVSWQFYKPINALMWSFIYSIAIANVLRIPGPFKAGIDFAAGTLLRASVAALGITVSALVWLRLGLAIIAPLFVVFFFFLFSYWLGQRLNLTGKLSALIGVGTGICGASAIAATGPSIEATDSEIALALSGVTLFGLLIMFLYPFLYLSTPVGQMLHHNDVAYAVWAGSTLYETAHVAAAGEQVSKLALDVALLVKSIRIFMIGPMAAVAAMLTKKNTGKRKLEFASIPAFAITFIVASLLSASLDLAEGQTNLPFLKDWSSTKFVLSNYLMPFLLSVAFAGVGFKVNIRALVKTGRNTFVVGAMAATLSTIMGLILAIILF